MTVKLPHLKPQEIPYDHPDSCNFFRPTAEKPLLATLAAIDMYRQEVILDCLRVLQSEADQHNGIDYLQIFEDPEKQEDLWFIEDGSTAIAP